MATRTISAAGGNYDAIGTYDELITPIAGDTIVARGDGTSGQLTINVATAALGGFDSTNWTGTLTLNNVLKVGGNCTLVAGMTIAGSSAIEISATATLTTGGKTIPALTMSGAATTVTLGDNCTVSGAFNYNCTGTSVLNSNILYVAGNVASPNAINWNGNTTLYFNGTGAQSFNSFNNTGINITFGSTNTISITGTFWSPLSGTIKHIPGCTVIPLATTQMGGGNATLILDCAGIVWNTISPTGNCTFQLTSDLNVTTLNSSFSIALTSTTANMNVASFSCPSISGVGSVKLTEVGNQTPSLACSSFQCGLIIDCNSGNIGNLTCPGSNTPVLQYIRGKITVTGTLSLQTAYSLIGLHKIKWQTVTITAGVGITMDYFFSGTSDNIITIQSATPGSSYTITVTGGHCVSNFTKISDCLITNTRGSVEFTYPFSNKGKNTGNALFGGKQGFCGLPLTRFFPNEIGQGFAGQGLRGWVNGS